MTKASLAAPKEMRFRWYRQADQYGKTIEDVCDVFGISRKTYYKWYNRDHGYAPNTYHSRRIHPHTKLTPHLQLAVIQAKRQYNYGPEKMRLYLAEHYHIQISSIAIYKFFKKRKLIRKPQRKQPRYTPMKERFISTKPGENVQLDVKYVPGGAGTWHYQFRFTDTYTNIQYAIDCLDKLAAAAIYALRLARRSFPFPILGLQTDNGSEFRGAFAIYAQRCHIVHRFIPKRSAPWNGKVERANRSIDDEYYLNSGRPWTSLAAYTRWYNHERYHLGIGMHGLTPHKKLHNYLTQQATKTSPLKVN
ncbi:MAG: DDE-type integrase/transposase/recombinase [Candidatus Kerfeldbacteria bacterium]|nr:DDE-type integrase/transposase/recombinase [Candidatus Kerfeldbacteria bacterium]